MFSAVRSPALLGPMPSPSFTSLDPYSQIWTPHLRFWTPSSSQAVAVGSLAKHQPMVLLSAQTHSDHLANNVALVTSCSSGTLVWTRRSSQSKSPSSACACLTMQDGAKTHLIGCAQCPGLKSDSISSVCGHVGVCVFQ